ncbi:unnamed protein product [Trichogramma brassicae]|uniref:Reverse transcriptase domain-containing protein n=1 Tax=Trichogramma brassicae TaxID=86971 RepID=A0A6H5IL33_9HYME|nr:unnamed protein product [Trichogramma brassicae]
MGYHERRWLLKTAGGRWPWKSESAKECVTTHLPKQLALKMDGAEASRLYSAVSGKWGSVSRFGGGSGHEALTSRRGRAAVCAEGSGREPAWSRRRCRSWCSAAQNNVTLLGGRFLAKSPRLNLIRDADSTSGSQRASACPIGRFSGLSNSSMSRLGIVCRLLRPTWRGVVTRTSSFCAICCRLCGNLNVLGVEAIALARAKWIPVDRLSSSPRALYHGTRSMTNQTSDWRRHDARRLVEVVARFANACCCTSSSSSAASSFDVTSRSSGERARTVETGIHVAAIQEPYCLKDLLPGMGLHASSVFEKQYHNNKTGAAISCFTKDITMLKLTDLCEHNVSCVELTGSFGTFILVSIYCKFSRKTADFITHLDKIMRMRNGREILICGDLNAKSPMWGSPYSDKNGTLFEEFLANHGLVVLNDNRGVPTFRSSNGSSNIDATFATSGIAGKLELWRTEEWGQSDHRPIRIVLNFEASPEPPRKKPRYHVSKADWGAFTKSLLDSKAEITTAITSEPIDVDNVDAINKTITDTIIAACDNSMPKSTTSRYKAQNWWTTKLNSLKKRTESRRSEYEHQLRRHPNSQSTRAAKRTFTAQRKEYLNEIRRAKRASWRRFVTKESTCSRTDQTTKATGISKRKRWNHDSKLAGNSSGSLKGPSPGRYLRRRLPSRPKNRSREHITRWSRRGCTRLYHPGGARSDQEELVREEPRPRRNPPRGTKESTGDPARDHFPFQQVLSTRKIPKGWKKGNLIPIPKPDKDETLAKSYRPICLLPLLGKTFERLIIDRASAVIHKEGHESDSQFGFKVGRSTEDAILKLRQIVEESTSKYACAIPLDISGAFDNLWWPSLTNILRARGCPTNIFRVLKDYLHDREVIIQSTHQECSKKVTKGTPQGSIFGPIAWNLQLDGLLSLIKEEGVPSIAYADDVIIVILGGTREELEAKADRILTMVHKWCLENKLAISVPKSGKIMLKGKLKGRLPTARLDGQSLKSLDPVKYLGLYVGKELNFAEHASRIACESTTRFHEVTRFSKANWGLRFNNLSTLYDCVFLPKITYAAAAWADKAGSSKKLQTAQRSALLGLTKAYGTTSHDALHVLAGKMPMDLKLKQRAAEYRIRKGASVSVEGLDMTSEEVCASKTSASERVRHRLIEVWQAKWNTSEKGKETFAFFPNIARRLSYNLQLDHYVTQLLTGHGNFAYYKFIHCKASSHLCACGETEDADHVLFDCPLRRSQRWALVEAAKVETGSWPCTKERLVANQVLFGELKKFARRVLDSRSSNTIRGERRREPRRDNRRRRGGEESQQPTLPSVAPTPPSVETRQQRRARSATDLETLEEPEGQ